jgi:hypothetical protein
MDIYKIPQPVPVDITYNVKIFCTKMRHLNEFNKLVLQKFSSRQAYTFVKGHYVPIILDNISDESVLDIEKRKYYIQNYNFTMLGFLIDEEEFQISPAITRALTLYEVGTQTKSRRAHELPENKNNFDLDILFVNGVTDLSENYPYTIDLSILETVNVSSYSFYINDSFLGDDLSDIQINTNDTVRVTVSKTDSNEDSVIKCRATLPYDN